MSSLSAERHSQIQQMPSPYLSESAHVLSLQRPALASSSRRTSRAPRLTPTSTGTPLKIADVATYVSSEIGHAHEEKHDASKLHKLFHHAKLRLKKHKSVCTLRMESLHPWFSNQAVEKLA